MLFATSIIWRPIEVIQTINQVSYNGQPITINTSATITRNVLAAAHRVAHTTAPTKARLLSAAESCASRRTSSSWWVVK